MYSPTYQNKEDMYNGILDLCVREEVKPAEERPELSPHYDAAKNSFKRWNSITFCSSCDDGKCACNRYIVHMVITACKMIARFDKLGVGRKIILTLHHFYRQDELEHFLKKFTEVRTDILIFFRSNSNPVNLK